MNDNISDKDKKDWYNFVNSTEKLPNKDIKYQKNKNLKVRSIDLTFSVFCFCGLKSLFGNLSLLKRKLCQSFLSLSEILSFN